MKYSKFIIENYKGITQPLTIDISKCSLIPIIGINECGKTTILNAIYAFDYINDRDDTTYHHLHDLKNLYLGDNRPTIISAVISIEKETIVETLIDSLGFSTEHANSLFTKAPEEIFQLKISRVFKPNEPIEKSTYKIDLPLNLSKDQQDNLSKQILLKMPYILYFDDFREAFPGEVEIPQSAENKGSGWLALIEELFQKTDESYSVFDLHSLDERFLKSRLARVKKKLNETLTSQWATFKFDEKESLVIDIDFKKEKKKVRIKSEQMPQTTVEREVESYFLKFDVIETDSNGNEHYFYVKDRSKGFYWFFNFVMKLEFNDKRAGDDENAIYLLDEPGSFLHPYAQTKLCKKLKELSKSNIMIYSTHSHYLLNPDYIPLNNVHVANKKSSAITLTPYHSMNEPKGKKVRTAFDTIRDALYIKPFDLDINKKKILIVEGIYDYYSYSLFKGNRDFGILPGKGASSLLSLISLMIGFEVDFRVLWDRDSEGFESYTSALEFFGEEIAEKNFFMLPNIQGKKVILQNLFSGSDMELIVNETNLDKSAKFEKKIAALFYSPKKERIMKKISSDTIKNFEAVFSSIDFN